MDINCAVFIDWGNIPTAGERSLALSLPCYPEEVAEQIAATWSTQNVIGRTGTLVAYTGTEDITTNFSFDLHREMEIKNNATFSDKESIDYIVKALKAACYPLYNSSASTMKPPLVMFQFGRTFISGRLTNVGITKKGPIIEDMYAIYSMSISMASVSTEILSKDDILE